MFSGISNFSNYDILFKTSMNEIRKTEGSDSLTQSLFGASIAALYGKQVNTNVMNDVNKFIETFENNNKLLLDSTKQLTESINTYSPPESNVEATIVAEPEIITDSDDPDVVVDNTNTSEVPEPAEDTRNSKKTSSQVKAVTNFVNNLNKTMTFIKDNKQSKNTELLSKRVNNDFTENKNELKKIGITKTDNGDFQISSEVFEKALKDDPKKVREILNDKEGFAAKVSARFEKVSKEPTSKFAFTNDFNSSNPYDNYGHTQTDLSFNAERFTEQIQLATMMQKGSIVNMLL